ncbi:hypothetical protein CC2G_008682 [Coprinopsis cinerea AmutBmut pab1-1]|nr:hypothetical protein CC2G_008682 [Coprinopsis cinerea AmutBmut pab1-1]
MLRAESRLIVTRSIPSQPGFQPDYLTFKWSNKLPKLYKFDNFWAPRSCRHVALQKTTKALLRIISAPEVAHKSNLPGLTFRDFYFNIMISQGSIPSFSISRR